MPHSAGFVQLHGQSQKCWIDGELSGRNARRLAILLGDRLGGYSDASAVALVSAVNLGIGGIWAATQPSPGMAAAYEEHPELASMRHDLRLALREYVATVLTGLAHREPVLPFAGTSP